MDIESLNKRIEELPEDPVGRLHELTGMIIRSHQTADWKSMIQSAGFYPAGFANLMTLFGMATECASQTECDVPAPELNPDDRPNCARVAIAHITHLHSWARSVLNDKLIRSSIARGREAYKDKVQDASIVFNEKELESVQSTLKDLRSRIGALDRLADAHRARLTRRIERLETELRQAAPDLDDLWATIVAGGYATLVLGGEGKAIATRLDAIVSIADKATRRGMELDRGAGPQLPTLARSANRPSAPAEGG